MVLYEALHPEAKWGAAGGGRDGKGTRSKTGVADPAVPVAPAFAEATAAEILDAAHREPLSVDWPEALRRARERYGHGK